MADGEIKRMKTIWIIDHYSSEPRFGGIARQYDFACELEKRGYNVVVIASGFSHFSHSYISDKEVYVSHIRKNVHYVYLKTSSYKLNGGIKRAKSMFSFMYKVLKYQKIIAQKYGKPDVVNGCSVHPLAWIAAYKISKIYHIRFCVEVRDLWPRIWVVSKAKSKYDPMVIFFGLLERWAYKKADRIIYSMPQGDKYICDELKFKRSKTYLIGQPMDCKKFDNNAQDEKNLPEEIRAFIEDGFICSFAGYYMKYEGVYVMLEAARILKERHLPVKMVFVGNGEEMDGMRSYVQNYDLNNVMINGRVPKEAVPALLSRSDVCMAHLEVEGHKEVYKYGVSKNKVNEYLYSGACTLYGFLYQDDAVASSGGGMVFEPYNAKELAYDIEKLYYMKPEDRKQYGIRGRKYIRDTHKVEKLTDKLLEVLFN